MRNTIFIIISILMTSCLSSNPTIPDYRTPVIPPDVPPKVDIINLPKEFTDNTSNLLSDSIKIQAASDRINALFNDDVKINDIKPYLKDDIKIIVETSYLLQQELKKTLDLNYRLDKLGRYIKDLETWGENEKASRKEMENKLTEMQKTVDTLNSKSKKSFMVIFFCITGICSLFILVGVYFITQGNVKIGTSLIGTGVVTIAITYFFIEYAWLISIFGGIFILLILILIYKQFISHKDDLEVHGSALDDIIGAIQEEKDTNPSFKQLWDTEIKQKLNTKYSKATKQLIRDIKGK